MEEAEPGTSLSKFSFPRGAPAVTSDDRLFVADNAAVKVFSNFDQGNGRTADFAMDAGGAVAARGNKLATIASGRVRIYNSAPTATDPDPDPDVYSSGLNDCSAEGLNSPADFHITPQGRLLVADLLNHRVLVWHSIPESGPLGAAHLVLGQPSMTHCVPNFNFGPPSAATLNRPWAVWSDDRRVIVVDGNNHRVLIWDGLNGFPNEDFAPATHVIGQPDFESNATNRGDQFTPSSISLMSPRSVDVSDTGQLAVVDSGNNRVLVWNSIPDDEDIPADQVLGQMDFTRRESLDPPNASSLRTPMGVSFHQDKLIVVDQLNYRVLVYRPEE
jgi:hypothetical protein